MVVTPYDEQVKEDVIFEERAKEVEDLNKITVLTSEVPTPSRTTVIGLRTDFVSGGLF